MKRYAQLNEAVAMTHGNVTKVKPFRILEVGCRQGDRARRLIQEAKKRGRPEVHFFGFGAFEAPGLSAPDYDAALRRATGVSKVNLFRGEPRKELPEHVATLPPMDVVLVAGSGRSFEDLEMDVGYALQAMSPKGVLLVDDYVAGDLSEAATAVVEKFRKEMVGAAIEIPPTFDEVNGRRIHMARISRRVLSPSATPATKTPETPIPTPAYEVISRETLGPPEVGPSGGFPTRVHNSDLPAFSVRPTGSQQRDEGPSGESIPDRRREPGLVDEPVAVADVPVQPAPVVALPEERSQPDQVLESGSDVGAGGGSGNLGSD